MILCITEKPSVGADIAKIVGATTRRDGYFEGNGYWVSWTYGHLCTLKEPADYTPDWRRWALSYLPMIPPRFGIKIIPEASIERQFNVLQSLIAQADEIINCGDAGQEGELIQRWVMQKAQCKIPVKRLWISSLTDEAIREGFAHLRPQEDLQPLYEAGLCRAIGDWILGINATRLYTIKYSSKRGQIISVGRVQTPTLALIVNRQKEIENFVPKDSWELRTLYRETTFTAQIKNFDSPDKGKEFIEKLKDLPFTVSDISKKKGSEAPPRLFDLTSLQVEANKKYGYSADDTLKTIQSLYEKKVTTYPRVDTTYLTDDIYPKCGPILLSLSHLSEHVDKLKGRKLKKSKKVFDNSKVTDHHAIIPTGQPLPSNLSEREANIFNMVAKRFIAAFYPDFNFEQTTVIGLVDKTKFKATGRVVLDEGWKSVFRENTTSADIYDKSDAESQNNNSVKDDNRYPPIFRSGRPTSLIWLPKGLSQHSTRILILSRLLLSAWSIRQNLRLPVELCLMRVGNPFLERIPLLPIFMINLMQNLKIIILLRMITLLSKRWLSSKRVKPVLTNLFWPNEPLNLLNIIPRVLCSKQWRLPVRR